MIAFCSFYRGCNDYKSRQISVNLSLLLILVQVVGVVDSL